MSKAIKDIKKIAFNIELNGIRCFGDAFRNIIKELERLETIDNAKPSEALECLEQTKEIILDGKTKKYNALINLNFEIIKQVLIQAQEQEEELAIYKLAYEWACNRIKGNPYSEILDEARRNNDAWKRINAGEKVGINK